MEPFKTYDLIIIGSGPAGLTASIYASRFRLKNIVFGNCLSSEVALSNAIENYPGFQSIKGFELAQKFREQAASLGADFVSEKVSRIEKPSSENPYFSVYSDATTSYHANAIILAAGTQRNKLNILGENEYTGKGVSFCAVCDGAFFRDKTVAVVGGGDSALTGAVLLSDIAKKVYLIYRKKKEELRAEPIWIERFEQKVAEGRGNFIFEATPQTILGNGEKVTGIRLYNGSKLNLDGIFIEIGSSPTATFTGPLGIQTNEKGYIEINQAGETNIAGIYAAGDITTGSNHLEQIITAAAEGAIAASSVYQWLKKQKR